MGSDHVKIHACRKDCILYKKECENFKKCPGCGASRYKFKDNSVEDDDDVTIKGVPAKVIWYLLIIQSFKRWHADERMCDGKICDIDDSLQWKEIDSLFPYFTIEPRNLRLGLTTDGMNLFGNMITNHDLWDVLLIIYNLSLWLCMKCK